MASREDPGRMQVKTASGGPRPFPRRQAQCNNELKEAHENEEVRNSCPHFAPDLLVLLYAADSGRPTMPQEVLRPPCKNLNQIWMSSLYQWFKYLYHRDAVNEIRQK